MDDNQAERENFITQGEAKRRAVQANFQPDPDLIAAGWEHRFTGDDRRVQEAAQLYSELGYEVLTVPVQSSDVRDECEGCRLIAALHFQTIYIRR